MGQGVVEFCSFYFRSISYSCEMHKAINFCFWVNTWKIDTLEM